MTLRETLLSMGYREVQVGKWLKPIGYHLFAVSEEKKAWTNWYKNTAGEVDLYQREDIQDDEEKWGDYLYQLKYFEAYTRIGIGDGVGSEFHLRGIDL